jgi:hypothetical protein
MVFPQKIIRQDTISGALERSNIRFVIFSARSLSYLTTRWLLILSRNSFACSFSSVVADWMTLSAASSE